MAIGNTIFWNHTHINSQEMFAFIAHNNLAVSEVPFYTLSYTASL